MRAQSPQMQSPPMNVKMRFTPALTGTNIDGSSSVPLAVAAMLRHKSPRTTYRDKKIKSIVLGRCIWISFEIEVLTTVPAPPTKAYPNRRESLVDAQLRASPQRPNIKTMAQAPTNNIALRVVRSWSTLTSSAKSAGPTSGRIITALANTNVPTRMFFVYFAIPSIDCNTMLLNKFEPTPTGKATATGPCPLAAMPRMIEMPLKARLARKNVPFATRLGRVIACTARCAG
mmetsp:Transcript_58881/g.156683  ORF Transcript_58881/g.156683 Transcript_58881/m.156683 type:complete len:230 (-) Transcript_58881:158-847(-)